MQRRSELWVQRPSQPFLSDDGRSNAVGGTLRGSAGAGVVTGNEGRYGQATAGERLDVSHPAREANRGVRAKLGSDVGEEIAECAATVETASGASVGRVGEGTDES